MGGGGGADELEFDPVAFETFAATSTERAGAFEALHTNLGSVILPPHAFGRLPFMDRLYDTYQELSQESMEGLQTAAEIMEMIADGALMSRESYDAANAAAIELIGDG